MEKDPEYIKKNSDANLRNQIKGLLSSKPDFKFKEPESNDI